jgi:SPP1 family predicted phage head-tail adaptor
MRAGKLDRLIIVERVSTTLDDAGVPAETWAPVASLRAERVTATMEEIMRGFGESSEGTIVFRTRYLDGLTLADRIVFEGRHLDIKAIHEISRRGGLEFRAVARGV